MKNGSWMEGGALVEKASLSRAEDQLVGVRNSFSIKRGRTAFDPDQHKFTSIS